MMVYIYIAYLRYFSSIHNMFRLSTLDFVGQIISQKNLTVIVILILLMQYKS